MLPERERDKNRPSMVPGSIVHTSQRYQASGPNATAAGKSEGERKPGAIGHEQSSQQLGSDLGHQLFNWRDFGRT